MALTLRITIGAACSGGGHFPITGTPTPGVERTYAYTREELDRPISPEEQETFIRVLTRLYRNQLTGSAAQIKTAIEAKLLDLGVS